MAYPTAKKTYSEAPPPPPSSEPVEEPAKERDEPMLSDKTRAEMEAGRKIAAINAVAMETAFRAREAEVKAAQAEAVAEAEAATAQAMQAKQEAEDARAAAVQAEHGQATKS